MEVVGIKMLKSHLSKYVSKAKKGEHIIITERGQEVAELVPISKERQVMKELIKQGKASWKGGKPEELKGVKVKGKTVAETVLESRR